MREKDLYHAIDRLVPKTVHRQSMTGASMTTNGTPDRYYDGPGGDLWVEFKQLKSMPRDGVVRGAYTKLQLQWMARRWEHGIYTRTNVIGVVGLPDKRAAIQRGLGEWKHGTPAAWAVSIKEVAEWITEFCGGYCSQPSRSRSTRSSSSGK